MRNQYAGTCYRCGKTVEPGDGFFEKITRKHRENGCPDKGNWRTQHKECQRKYFGTDHHYMTSTTIAGER